MAQDVAHLLKLSGKHNLHCVTITVYGKQDCADVIDLRILKRGDHTGLSE